MSSTVGRNSLIMATGTAASRVTGQIRTILLASAVGTTGIAANAYQAGSMIPQEVFTLVSGGIFNAVLVPQIVRTLQHKDAEDRLNKLITFVITLLLGVTLLMTLGTPLLTRLYVGGDGDMLALTNAFTLWCMPQIFFYGLYTVVGQILAAKNRFGTYAWSSVGANIISSAGFIAFIALFGRANRRPLGFWTSDKIMLTAGAWTLGVAFQALVLFFPLHKTGLRYRPSWGVKGIGLRSMGPVAAWSIGIVVIGQLATIIDTNVTTSAPDRAMRLLGLSQYQVAGNASYQNAATIYLLPYALIAVSVATAVFPRIAQAIASHDLDGARKDLSQALRNVGLLMCFFTVAFIVMPTPITLALLPSVSVHEALLIAGPMTALAVSLPLGSAYLIIQRTFYAFADGRRPFLFTLLQTGLQLIVLMAGVLLLSPVHWATLLGASVTSGYLLAFPILAKMIHKRFEGRVDGRRIIATYTKALIAMGAAIVGGLWMRRPAYALVGAHITSGGGTMNWFQALAVCLILGVIVAVLYTGVLWLLRTQEFISIVGTLSRRFLHRPISRPADTAVPAMATRATAADTAPDSAASSTPDRNDVTGDIATRPPMFDPRTHAQVSPGGHALQLKNSTSPTGRMSTASQSLAPPSRQGIHRGAKGIMKPELGDVVINRYTLVSLLRSQPGLQAWKANDRVLARDCQLFLISDADAVPQVSAIASSMALSHNAHVTPVLQLQHRDGVAIVVTQLDAGSALGEYCQGRADRMMSFGAMRSVLAQSAQLAQQLLDDGLEQFTLSTDTIRVTAHGVQFADVPLCPLLDDVSRPPQSLHNEQLAIWQLAAVLYALLTDTPSADVGGRYDLSTLPSDTPEEFQLICRRGLSLRDKSGNASVPMLTLAELTALLGEWKPFSQLTSLDMTKPGMNGPASISTAALRNTADDRLINVTDTLFTSEKPAVEISPANAGMAVGAFADYGDADDDANAGYGTAVRKDTDDAELDAVAGTADASNQALDASDRELGPDKGSSPFKELKSLWDRGKAALTGSGRDDDAAQDMQDLHNSQGDDIPVFRDIAAAEMAQIMAPDAPGDDEELFPNFDFTMGGESGGTANPTMQFDLSSPQFMNASAGLNDAAAQPFAATGRIPIIDENGNPVEPGAESRRALAQEQAQREAAQDAERGIRSDQNSVQGDAPTNAQDVAQAPTNDEHHDSQHSAQEPPARQPAPSQSAVLQGTARDDTAVAATAGRAATVGIYAPDLPGAVSTAGTSAAGITDAPANIIRTANAEKAAAAMPPSFAPATRPSKPTAAPHAVPHGEFSDAATDDSVDDIADDDIADTPLFGGFTTKIVSLVVVVIVVIAALFFALQGLAGRNSNGTSQNGSNPWPSANLNDVPFGPSQRASGNDKASSASASATTSPSQSASESITKQPIKAPSIITADKNAAQVPEPQVPLNTTPYNIQRRQFLVNPGGQRGFGYYIQLSQPEKAYRFVIKIRSSGGHAYLFANSTNDPAQGEQVADFAFDPSLTTDVKFTKPVTSQDFLLWVPMNSLPNHKLYVDMVQIY